MKKTLKIIFLSLIIISTQTQSIQNSTVNYVTATMAGFSAGGSYQLYKKFPGKIHPVFLAGISFLSTIITYYILQQATPLYRLKRANQLLTDISRHTLARMTFNNDLLFFDTVQDVYITNDLPLISAYNHLIALMPIVRYALSLINKASAEVDTDVLLQEECNASLSRANKLFKNISEAIKRIREHKDYLPQLTLYKENLLHEKQTIAQEQMALAQLQSAHAQQGNTLLKWLKAVI